MSLSDSDRSEIAAACRSAVAEVRRFASGNTTQLSLVILADGTRLVAKQGEPGANLALEGAMLGHLHAEGWPVPAPVLARDDLVVMGHMPGGGGLTATAQAQAAEILAPLHAVPRAGYGFAYDTLIGPLHQPNPPGDDWVAFFRDHRLLHMARAALDEGALDTALMARIERLAERLEELIGPPAPPSLIHGDIWGGNVMAEAGRITGFIDPAIYHADAEIELAFTTLFSTFGEPFFRRYHEIRPIRDGFFEVRRDLYNLYPLLVHVRLFGGGYVGSVASIVRRLVG